MFDDDGKLLKDRWNDFKDYAPKHWQGKGFGKDLLNLCYDDKVFTDGLDFNFRLDVEKGRRKLYRVPRYIVRKALYRIDDKERLVLNERGVKVFGNKQLFIARISKLNSDYRHFFSLDWLNSRLMSSDFDSEFGDIDSTKSLIYEFKYLLGSRSLRELALYTVVKDRSVLRSTDVLGRLYIESFEKMTIDQLESACYDVYRESLIIPVDSEFNVDGFKDQMKVFRKSLFSFNDLERFQNFDVLLQLFDKVKYIYNCACEKKYLEDKKQRKLLKYQVA